MKKLLLIGMVLVGGCSKPAQSVDYYKTHPDALDQRLTDCTSQGDMSQDCQNARQAFYEIKGIPAKDGKAL